MPDVLSLGRAISLWEGWLRLRALSERTIDSYIRSLDMLENHLGRNYDPSQVTIDDITALAASWRGISPSTSRTRLIALSEFFKWGEQRYGWANPMRLVVMPKRDKPILRRLSDAEVEAILRAAAGMDERSRLVILLHAHLGLRRGEVLLLRWRDVDLVESTISVYGKGRKARVVPIPPPLLDALAHSKTLRGPGADDHCYLLPLRRRGGFVDPASMIEWHHPSSGDTIDAIVKRAAELGGLQRPHEVSSHMFRRYILGRLLDAGVSPYAVAALAGHADIQTTANYGGGASLRSVSEALRTHGLRDTPSLAHRKPLPARESERTRAPNTPPVDADPNDPTRPQEEGS